MCFPPSQRKRFSGVRSAVANERRAAQNHLSEDWHWSFSTGSSEYWFGFNQSSEWGNMTHTQTLMMLSSSIYSVLITFGAGSRFALCYKIPATKPQNWVMPCSSSTTFPWWQNRNPLPFGVGAGVCEDRRLGIVCLLIKFAQGNFVIFDVLWQIFQRDRFPKLEVTLFERNYDKIFHSFGDDLEAHVAQRALRQKVVLGFKFHAIDRPEIVVELKMWQSLRNN